MDGLRAWVEVADSRDPRSEARTKERKRKVSTTLDPPRSEEVGFRESKGLPRRASQRRDDGEEDPVSALCVEKGNSTLRSGVQVWRLAGSTNWGVVLRGAFRANDGSRKSGASPLVKIPGNEGELVRLTTD